MLCPAKSLQSSLILCDSVRCSPPGSSVRGILQARELEWVARPSSRGSSRPRDWTRISYISWLAVGFFTTSVMLSCYGSNLSGIVSFPMQFSSEQYGSPQFVLIYNLTLLYISKYSFFGLRNLLIYQILVGCFQHKADVMQLILTLLNMWEHHQWGQQASGHHILLEVKS